VSGNARLHRAVGLSASLERDGRFRKGPDTVACGFVDAPAPELLPKLEAAKRGTRARRVRWVAIETPTGVLLSRESTAESDPACLPRTRSVDNAQSAGHSRARREGRED
jgi:hypothetical protein